VQPEPIPQFSGFIRIGNEDSKQHIAIETFEKFCRDPTLGRGPDEELIKTRAAVDWVLSTMQSSEGEQPQLVPSIEPQD